MKTYQYQISGKTFTLRLSDIDHRAVCAEVDGVALVPTAEEMPFYAAAISLALLQREAEEVHDEEVNRQITIQARPTAWTDRCGQMRQRML